MTTTLKSLEAGPVESADDERLQQLGAQLGLAPEAIQEAVQAVGRDPDDVLRYLERRQGAGYN